jgi:outer membrane protein assembly factor BamC
LKIHMNPSNRMTPSGLTLALLLSSMLLSGCSTINDTLVGEKIDYKSGATKGPSLDIPPDLSQLTRDNRYAVPGVAVTANTFQSDKASRAGQVGIAASNVGDVRIERSGNQRWLVVNRPADKLWEPVREFWKTSGFQLAIDQQDLGIIETDFAENRAKLPQDFIRNTLGRVLENLYSTGERDKFRTRLERTASGGTEIFISHRGMIEVVTNSSGTSTSTVWQPRPADPELEAEFLRRLMVQLGVSPDQSKALIAVDAARQTSRIETVNNQQVLLVDDGFDRAWRRVGLGLDRTGFTVEDRDRSKGLYFVRYVAPLSDNKSSGFFGNLFSSKAATPAPLKYQIVLTAKGDMTSVTVLNADGKPDTTGNAQRIFKVLADDLK